MHDFWNKRKSLVQSELTLQPDMRVHNLSEQLNSLWKFLSMRW